MSKDTRQHFLEGPALRPCRDALGREGFKIEIKGGCLVFVHPHQYEDVLRAVANTPLTYADVIFAESFEYYVQEASQEALAAGCQGSWMKSRDQLPVDDVDDADHIDQDAEESMERSVDGEIAIDRTFLVWRPKPASHPKAMTD